MVRTSSSASFDFLRYFSAASRTDWFGSPATDSRSCRTLDVRVRGSHSLSSARTRVQPVSIPKYGNKRSGGRLPRQASSKSAADSWLNGATCQAATSGVNSLGFGGRPGTIASTHLNSSSG